MSYFKYKRTDRGWDKEYGRFLTKDEEKIFSRIMFYWFLSFFLLAYVLYFIDFDLGVCQFCEYVVNVFPSIDRQTLHVKYSSVAKMLWSYSILTGPIVVALLCCFIGGIHWRNRPIGYLILFFSLGILAAEQIFSGTIFGVEMYKIKLKNAFFQLYSETIIGAVIFIFAYWIAFIWCFLITIGFIQKFIRK